MARLKKSADETTEETEIRRIKETIANAATRNEKVAWDRKMNNMVSLLAKLQPIEDQITELLATKMPIIDMVQVLRTEMVNSCIHPYTHQIEHENHIVCKFCNRKFNVVDKI